MNLPLPVRHDVGFDEALNQHWFTYLALQSDLCHDFAAEHYRTSLRLTGALFAVAQYDGAIPRIMKNYYINAMNHSRILMGKIRSSAVAELVRDLDEIHENISGLETY